MLTITTVTKARRREGATPSALWRVDLRIALAPRAIVIVHWEWWPMELTRDAAWALVTEWTQSESLRKHMLAVEAAVRGYARQFGEDEEAWGVVALLHDFDYERYPDAEHHPFEGVEVLKAWAIPTG